MRFGNKTCNEADQTDQAHQIKRSYEKSFEKKYYPQLKNMNKCNQVIQNLVKLRIFFMYSDKIGPKN